MMVFELIELLKQQDPHATVRNLCLCDLPEYAAEIHGVKTEATEPGCVFLSTAKPPVEPPRMHKRER